MHACVLHDLFESHVCVCMIVPFVDMIACMPQHKWAPMPGEWPGWSDQTPGEKAT